MAHKPKAEWRNARLSSGLVTYEVALAFSIYPATIRKLESNSLTHEPPSWAILAFEGPQKRKGLDN